MCLDLGSTSVHCLCGTGQRLGEGVQVKDDSVRRRAGEPYYTYRLVESVRIDGRVRQRT